MAGVLTSLLSPSPKGDQESLLLEGLPGTPQPHRLPLAGTTFQLRQGPDQTQSLEALGPINASLIVMVTAGLGARCRRTLASFWDLELGFYLILPRPPPLRPQVLTRTELPALRYRFNAPIARDALPPYSWHYAPWTKCSAQCAGGEPRTGTGWGRVWSPG